MLLWLSLAFWLALSVAGLLFAVERGVHLWRAFRRLSSAVGGRLEEIARSADQIQGHLEAAERAGGRLQQQLATLRVSRARLDVLLQALREARAQIASLFWFMPQRR
jgi:hypothetical protein